MDRAPYRPDSVVRRRRLPWSVVRGPRTMAQGSSTPV